MLAGLIPFLASAETGDVPTTPDRTLLPAACPDAIKTDISDPPVREGLPTYLWAREFDAIKGGVGEASGNVELIRADQHVSSEHITWDMEAQRVIIPGDVSYRDAQVWLDAGSGDYDIDDETGTFTGVDYGLVETSAHGSAGELTLVGGTTSYLNDIDFTTCPGDAPIWILSAEELELRHDEGQGVARNAKLKFGKVPVLYVPWFTFPIDGRRKSGFLYPSIGKADDTGFEVSVPWYWNIAPNQDATIVPRWFTDRGFMLTGEYRLLTERSAGQVNFDYMPNDDETDESRYQVALNHEAALSRRWHSEVTVNRVSDDDYFQDFGNSLAQTSRQYLPTRASLDGGGRYWTFIAMADDFQVIDRAVGPLDEPYRRLPRFLFTLDRPLGSSGLLFSLDSELVYFDRDVGVEGGRSDLLGQLTYDITRPWGYARPSVGYRWTGYDLDRPTEGLDDSPSRGVSVLSFDTGLFFDRLTASGRMQTLEPRLYYLYVPFEEQGSLPDFDTGTLTFGFSSLFHTNWFAGADRQTNANQLSLGLVSRTFEGTGRQLWSIGVAQAFLFEDQKVSLDDEIPLVDNVTPFITEATWNPTKDLLTRAELQWDWENSEVDVFAIGADWTGEWGQRLAGSYRFRRDRVDQVDLAALWPIGQSWRLFARANYSFDDSSLLEASFGVEYESCCWAIRTVVRRYVKNRRGETRDAIYLELNLKGLASFGREAPSIFSGINN